MNSPVFAGLLPWRSLNVGGRRSRRLQLARSVWLCLLALPGVAAGQTGAGVISGTVTDPSGGVIAGAAVTIANPVSGFTRTASTDASGSSASPTFPSIPII